MRFLARAGFIEGPYHGNKKALAEPPIGVHAHGNAPALILGVTKEDGNGRVVRDRRGVGDRLRSVG